MVGFTSFIKNVLTKSDENQDNSVISTTIQEEDFNEKSNQKDSLKDNPRLILNLRGQRSLLGTDNTIRIPIRFSYIQSLMLQALLGIKAPKSPLWCNILNRKLISNVTLVMIDGWDLPDLTSILPYEGEAPRKKIRVSQIGMTEGSNRSEQTSSFLEGVDRNLPNTSSCFPLKIEVESPSEYSDEPIAELFSTIPMSANVIEIIKDKYKSLSEAVKFHIVSNVDSKIELKNENPLEVPKPVGDVTPVKEDHRDEISKIDLLLSLEEMAKFKYPLNIKGTISGTDTLYVPLHSQYDEVTPNSPMFGIDCEMCLTTAGSELTRVSVVDEQLNVTYSSFVKPDNPIVNYITRYSGVIPNDLKNVTTSLEEVQQKLRELLPKDCILVGHSLESDLTALKLFHPYVIDTSLIYNLSHDVHYKPSLKLLTKLFLNKDIQNRGRKGHNPTEDALASLELALLKLKNSGSFGDVNKGGKLPCSTYEYLKIKRVNKAEKSNNLIFSNSENYESTVPKIIRLELGNSSICITNNPNSKYMFESYGVDGCHLCDKLKHLFKIEPEAHTTYKLVVRHCQVPCILTSGISREKLQKKLNYIDKRLSKLHKSVPENTLFMVLFTKKSDFSVPEKNRPNSLLLLDLKGQDPQSFDKCENTLNYLYCT